eukprot:gb/GECG01016154.1/.p2 GENE.gb/GECG01016154.1/~~gb/GECG01016154.1/.p2  ORF type:complete len:103 (-),score=7.16 gb/GECG01016154.1/:79-387(-)
MKSREGVPEKVCWIQITGERMLGLTLCLIVAVIVVDTEGAFRAERVAQIAEQRFSLNPEDVLENILIARVYTHGTSSQDTGYSCIYTVIRFLQKTKFQSFNI